MYIVVSNYFGIKAKVVSFFGDSSLLKARLLVRTLAIAQLESVFGEGDGNEACSPKERLSGWHYSAADDFDDTKRGGCCPNCISNDETLRDDWPYYYYADLDSKRYRIVFPYWGEESVVSFDNIDDPVVVRVLWSLATAQKAAIDFTAPGGKTTPTLKYNSEEFGSYVCGVHPCDCKTNWAKLCWPYVLKTKIKEEEQIDITDVASIRRARGQCEDGADESPLALRGGKVHVLAHDSIDTHGFINVDNELSSDNKDKE